MTGNNLGQPQRKPGFVVVLSAPSGGGKTTILRRLLDSGDPAFCYSVSATTRKPRNGERHGVDYYFLSPEEFRAMAERGEFIEHAVVHNHFYGTPRQRVTEWMAQGRIVLMDLDVQGGLNVKKQLGDQALLIFIAPPSLEALRQRLHLRNTDAPEEIDSRLNVAEAEMRMAEHYDAVVTNHDLEQTTRSVLLLINRRR